VLARPEHARTAVLQADFHFAAEHEQPLRRGGAVELAAKSDRAHAQLQAAGRDQRRQHRLRRAFAQRHLFLAEFRAAVGAGIEDDLGERGHVDLRLI
jgi:hypothetical protein